MHRQRLSTGAEQRGAHRPPPEPRCVCRAVVASASTVVRAVASCERTTNRLGRESRERPFRRSVHHTQHAHTPPRPASSRSSLLATPPHHTATAAAAATRGCRPPRATSDFSCLRPSPCLRAVVLQCILASDTPVLGPSSLAIALFRSSPRCIALHHFSVFRPCVSCVALDCAPSGTVQLRCHAATLVAPASAAERAKSGAQMDSPPIREPCARSDANETPLLFVAHSLLD